MDATTIHRRRTNQFLALVTVAGVAVTGLLVWQAAGADPLVPWPAEFAVLASLLVLSEQFPLTIPHGRATDTITLSGVFACAMLLHWEPAVVIAAQVVASVIEDLRARRAWWKIAFNCGQYAMSLAAAAVVIRLVQPVVARPMAARDILAGLAGAAVFFLVNNVLAGAAIALVADRGPVTGFLMHDARFQLSANGLMSALAPVVVAAADHSLVLMPLLVLPLIAVHAAARTAIDRAHRLTHDTLTDLANRTLFEDDGTAAIVEARNLDTRVAVLVIDIDSFREVNDTLGHSAGDALLRQIGPRLASLLGPDDLIARLGGDAFAMLLTGVAGRDDAVERGRALLRRVEEPFTLRDLTLDLRATIGVAVFPDDGRSMEDLMRHADVAMDVAKARRTRVEAYDPARNRHNYRRLTLLTELRPAIAAGQFEVHYQPQVSMETGRIVAVEALLRWHHPVVGPVSPSEFIPLAEHTGLIVDITDHVMDQTCAQLRAWANAGIEVPMAVNMSPRALLDPGVADNIIRRCSDHDVPATLLALELTETDLMADPDRSLEVLGALSDIGIRLSIDDFGTGYSSLAYLKTLPVSEVKIDRSFITHVATDPSDRIIVQSTVDLARNLGMRVVAEGVETIEAWRTLAWIGCDVAQGFLISRPEPADVVTAMLLRPSPGGIGDLTRLAGASRPDWL